MIRGAILSGFRWSEKDRAGQAQLAVFLGLEPDDIGQLGGGRSRATGRLDVAMLQSLVKRNDLGELIAAYGHVVVDECHHVPAVSFERVLKHVKART